MNDPALNLPVPEQVLAEPETPPGEVPQAQPHCQGNVTVLPSPPAAGKNRGGRPRLTAKIEKVCNEWLDARRPGLAPSSIEKFEQINRDFIAFCRRKELRNPSDVTWQHIAAWSEEMIRAGLSHKTIETKLGRVRAIYRMLIEEGRVTTQPVNRQRLPKPPIKPYERKALSYDQFQKLLEACEQRKGWKNHGFPEWFPAAFTIGFYTGLRISDVAALQWEGEHSRVDLDAEEIIVYPIKLRFAKKVVIPIAPDLHEVLVMLYDRRVKESVGNRVLPIMHGALRIWRSTYDAIRRCFKAAGLSDYSFHSFRHGFVTRMLNAGVDPMLICSITGQSLKIVQQYGHISTDAKRLAMHNALMHEIKGTTKI